MTSSSWQTRQAFLYAGGGAMLELDGCCGCEISEGCLTTSTPTRGTTFQPYPEGFHSWSNGCVLPAVSRARARIVGYASREGAQVNPHCRHPNAVRCSGRSRAGLQLRPPSTLTSTAVTGPASPLQATPDRK